MDLALRYDTFSGDLNYLKDGAGANINLGYASNGRLAFEGGVLLDSAHDIKSGYTYWLSEGNRYKFFNNFKYGGFVLNLKYYLMKGRYFPFLKAGAGLYGLAEDENYGLAGTGYQIGGGVEQYISRKFLIQFGLMHRIVDYKGAIFDGKSYTLNNPFKGNTTSIELGVAYRFWN